jgi:hypothetical protein
MLLANTYHLSDSPTNALPFRIVQKRKRFQLQKGTNYIFSDVVRFHILLLSDT